MSNPDPDQPANLDADLHNADWTKQTWDLPTTATAFLLTIGAMNHPDDPPDPDVVRQFLQLPAAQAMPTSLRTELHDRLGPQLHLPPQRTRP